MKDWDRSSVPDLAVQAIARFELFKADAYLDSAGHPTIGYGSLHMPDGTPVALGMSISEDEASALLMRQTTEWASAVAKRITAPLNEHQASALISFTHNVGTSAFTTSALAAMIDSGHYDLAAGQFIAWSKAGGILSLGLLRRRELERRIFLGGDMSAYAEVWALQMADLMPAYGQAFVDARTRLAEIHPVPPKDPLPPPVVLLPVKPPPAALDALPPAPAAPPTPPPASAQLNPLIKGYELTNGILTVFAADGLTVFTFVMLSADTSVSVRALPPRPIA